MTARLDDLLDAWCDGVLGEAELAELDQLLLEPAAARHAALRLALHAELQADGRAAASSAAGASTLRREARRSASTSWSRLAIRRARRGPRSVAPFVAIAAALAAAGIAIAIAIAGRGERADGVARVVSAGAIVVATAGDRPAPPGTFLVPGDRLRATATASIAWSDGTVVSVAPGGEVALGGDARDKRLVLERGSATAEVAPQRGGAAFRIASRSAEARALGTRFTLAVEDDRARLDVDHGVVRLTRLGDGACIDVAAGSWSEVVPGGALAAHGAGAPASSAATQPSAPTIGFALIDADTGAPIAGFDPIEAQAVITLARLPARRISIALRGDAIDAVDFTLWRGGIEIHRQHERFPPFTLYGDTTGSPDCTPWPAVPGTYRLRADLAPHDGDVRAVELAFTVR